MPDNPKRRGKQDRTRVSVAQRHERRYWANRFGCSQTALVLAVQFCQYRFDRAQDSVEAVGSVIADAQSLARKRT